MAAKKSRKKISKSRTSKSLKKKGSKTKKTSSGGRGGKPSARSKTSAKSKTSKAKKPSKASKKPSKAPRPTKAKAASKVRPAKAVRARKSVTKASTREGARPSNFGAALKLYETGFRLLHGDQFAKAKAKLGELIDEFPGETELLDRANVLIQVCNMRIRMTKRAPKFESADDYYQAGVAELNRRQLDKAFELLRKALKLAPEGDHIHYALGALAALQEDVEEALGHLRTAIEYRDENRFLAVNDTDFESLSENAEFIELVSPEGG